MTNRTQYIQKTEQRFAWFGLRNRETQSPDAFWYRGMDLLPTFMDLMGLKRHAAF